MTEVIAIFDIGKTNKKFFLFDKELNMLYTEYREFQELTDEDGFPCDDLKKIEVRIEETLKNFLSQKGKYSIQAVNFSTYGASLVHIDENGEPLTPLYNYLKPLLEGIEDKIRRRKINKSSHRIARFRHVKFWNPALLVAEVQTRTVSKNQAFTTLPSVSQL